MTQDKPPREIKVKEHTILVDAEDYPFLSRFTWHIKKDKNTFYAYTTVYFKYQTRISMHRLITRLRNVQVDHINRNGLDNRKENLRYCTNAENSRNRVRKNKYGYRGVYKPNGKNKKAFAYQIRVDGKWYGEYGFQTAEEAARAYDKKSKELHGEFGIRNFKD